MLREMLSVIFAFRTMCGRFVRGGATDDAKANGAEKSKVLRTNSQLDPPKSPSGKGGWELEQSMENIHGVMMLCITALRLGAALYNKCLLFIRTTNIRHRALRSSGVTARSFSTCFSIELF